MRIRVWLAGGLVMVFVACAGGEAGVGIDSPLPPEAPPPPPPPPTVSLPPPAPEIVTAGNNHSCTVRTSVANCWGMNEYGQLGNGATNTVPSQNTVTVNGGLSLRSVSAGAAHSCGLTTPGAAYCWGLNSRGKLGDGTLAERTEPVLVSGGRTFSTLNAGFGHSCGVASTGEAYCWGSNEYGQLGDGTETERHVPVAVSGGFTFRSLSGDRYHSCGITPTGKAYCWGYNADGQLGIGERTLRHPVPTAVAGDLQFESLDTGQHHTCGVTVDGEAYCWGLATDGMLGTNTAAEECGSDPCTRVPLPVSAGLTFRSVSAGANYTCGVTTSDRAYCWGKNTYGKLGIGAGGSSDAPIQVAGGLSFRAVSAGTHHTCGVATNEAVYCWGLNARGETSSDVPLLILSP